MVKRPPYAFLDHTADAKFQAYGATLEEAFANAALAVASLIADPASVAGTIVRPVNIEGQDKPQLLVRFLEEVLFLLDTEGFLLAGVENVHMREVAGRWSLEALFRGDRLSEKHALHGGVKAVTYNEMWIDERDGVTVQVVLDV